MAERHNGGRDAAHNRDLEYDRERGGAMHFANVKRVQFLEVLRQLTVDGE